MKCRRCGDELRRENIYVLGYCEGCLIAIVQDYEARLEEPIDVEIVQQ
jgi:hypothetical protein